VAEGSLLVDLALMKTIRIDAAKRTAAVGGGVTCAELDAATQQHGLAAPLPTVSSIGVAGAALGGGSGYLSRKHGLALDNVLSFDVVTADGRAVRASEHENGDLFWALRGGGGNFGVVTSMELRLHAVGPDVLSGQIIYPFERAGGCSGSSGSSWPTLRTTSSAIRSCSACRPSTHSPPRLTASPYSTSCSITATPRRRTSSSRCANLAGRSLTS
jgi:hypothetical protein